MWKTSGRNWINWSRVGRHFHLSWIVFTFEFWCFYPHFQLSISNRFSPTQHTTHETSHDPVVNLHFSTRSALSQLQWLSRLWSSWHFSKMLRIQHSCDFRRQNCFSLSENVKKFVASHSNRLFHIITRRNRDVSVMIQIKCAWFGVGTSFITRLSLTLFH